MVDICWEGHSQRSAHQKRHTHRCHPGNRAAGTREVIRRHPGECARQAPGRLSCSDLGRAQNIGPTESAPLGSTREPEPERIRPGKCTQARAQFRQCTHRAPWNLSSVDWESTHAVNGGKPSVKTARTPHTRSDICLQCSSLPTPRLKM